MPKGGTREVKAAEILAIGQQIGRWSVTGWTDRRTVHVVCECGQRRSIRLGLLLEPGAGGYGCGRHRPGASTAVLARGTATAAARAHARLLERVATGKKLCPACGDVKSLSRDFWPAPSMPDGHDGWCKTCHKSKMRQAYQRRKAERLAQQDAAFAASPELRTAALALEWRLNIPPGQARQVALLIEPSEQRWQQPALDRAEVVANMPYADLTRLAAQARVRPRPGRRQPAHPQQRHLPEARAAS